MAVLAARSQQRLKRKYMVNNFIRLVFLIVCCSSITCWATDTKVYVGYQGWFGAEGDGMNMGFRHYTSRDKYEFARSSGVIHDKRRITFEMWPDLSEFTEAEKFDTGFKHKDGTVAQLFSSAHPETVNRHFKWMSEYKIDGAFLQRFPVGLKNRKDNRNKKFLNKVLNNVRQASLKNKVGWALMYDISGLKKGDIDKILIPDLKELLKQDFTNDKYYIKHNGKPLISIWGAGFKERKYTLTEIQRLVTALKDEAQLGDFSVMLGIPYNWRTLGSDTTGDQQLHELVKQADIISPWSVGRYSNSEDVKTRVLNDMLIPDKRKLDMLGKTYLPVMFAGFSWFNLMNSRNQEGVFEQIPRNNGKFFWSQAVASKQVGVDMVYIAMFDEVDEATSIFKVSNNPPIGKVPFLTYKGNPSDHYLWLTSQIKTMLNKPNNHQNIQFPTR